MTRWLPLSWAVVLTVLLLGPALAPGYVILRDMVWVPDLALRPEALGLGSALPRAVPSDAVVAALDEVVPGMLLQKIALVGALVAAGTGAAALVQGRLVARLVAVSVAVWNPFVVERLAMGHWPVLLGYGAVPWLAVAGRRTSSDGRVPAWTPLVLLVGSLSASAGLVSAAVLLATGLAGGVRRRSTVLLVAAVLAANAPWLVAGLAHASAAADAGGYRVFATAGDGLPAPLAVLTLGGIWNADVVPAARQGVLAWVALGVTVGLAVLGARRWWRVQGRGQATAHVALWAVGVLIALTSWAAPGALAALGELVPGMGVLRDGSRSLALALPLTVGVLAAGAAALVERAGNAVGRWALAVAVVLVPVAVLPQAAWGMGGTLTAVSYPQEWRDLHSVVRGDGGAVLLPWSAYRAPSWAGRRPVLDPLARLSRADVVADDDLVVGGATVAGEDARAAMVGEALSLSGPEARAAALRASGIRWVVVEKDAGAAPDVAGRVVHDGPMLQVVRLEGRVRPSSAATGTVVAQTLAWAAFLALLGVGIVGTARRVRVRMDTRGLPAGSVTD